MGVLRILNEALTQLHPNGWTTMRAFRIMTQAGADMSAFRLARTNRIAVSGGPSLNPPLNQTPGPRDALADVVPPPYKDPKGKHKHKKRSHCDHRSGSGEASDHKEGSSREKILKQKMLEF
ncbi:hypothetical protein JHK87_025108 [Glycine soja]|nr:hypothetical protein JHK87_025108 [Glycine soja]